jgi:hypothetical protein
MSRPADPFAMEKRSVIVEILDEPAAPDIRFLIGVGLVLKKLPFVRLSRFYCGPNPA